MERVKRNIVKARKRLGKMRDILPNSIIRQAKDVENKLIQIYKRSIDVKHKSEHTNVYHCALQKTGTQWMFDIFKDPVVYKYSGMTVEKFDVPRRKSQAHKIRSLDEPYKSNTIIFGFAGTYKNFCEDIPKRDDNIALFHVVRDPREMVVSWYFSTKDNHLVDKGSTLHVHREKLREKSKKEGIKYVIELFDWKGKFEVMRSWMHKRNMDNVKIIKFEELASGDISYFRDLFDFLDVQIPENELRELIDSYSFETLTGRKRGKEVEKSHMRSGSSKSWKNHLDKDLIKMINSKAGDLLDGYGYV